MVAVSMSTAMQRVRRNGRSVKHLRFEEDGDGE
jgi:hypothetical protein